MTNNIQAKTRALDDINSKTREGNSDLEALLRDKEDELEITKQALDQALEENHMLQMVCGKLKGIKEFWLTEIERR